MKILKHSFSSTLRRLELFLIERINWNNNLVIFLMLAAVLPFLFLIIAIPLEENDQIAFGVAICLVSLLVGRFFNSRLIVIILILSSVTMTARYFYWRVTSTLGFTQPIEYVLGFLLLSAEIYGVTIMSLGYFQSIWPVKRTLVKLPDNEALWPTVDIFIPTYNEPLSIVSTTILAAQSIDWPLNKLNIYLLDDGNRESFKKFAQDAGVHYLTRTENTHAKAGNLNAALKRSKGDYVAIFDCDHIPTRSFLQMTMGWFLKDHKLAVMQTPHYFFSPDPIERNLKVHGHIPNEGELFYGVVQEGNDYWNASFFCGSCAVLKRSALNDIGGIAVETVTEDAHTALKLSRKGYNLGYISVPQAAGLATESLNAHVNQRIRWARGMAQIFRIDNPFFGRGLKLGQRLCYATAMLGFFYSVPRLIFLIAPMAYLIFGWEIYQTSAMSVFIYALPHLFMAQVAGHKIQNQFRHSFWGEIYDTLLAPYLLLPVLVAMINPKAGNFGVTRKGVTRFEKNHFDFPIAAPTLALLGFNLIGLGFGIFHNVYLEHGNLQTTFLNLFWVIFNIVILLTCLYIAYESKELRSTPRVEMELPAAIYLPNGKTLYASTRDFSSKGFSLQLPPGYELKAGKTIEIGIFRGVEEIRLPFEVKTGGNILGLQIGDLSVQDQRKLVEVTFSRADNWAQNWGINRQVNPLTSFKELMGHALLNHRRLSPSKKLK